MRIPQNVYDQVRPLLQYVVLRQTPPSRANSDTHVTEWTPEKNAHRVALINKKHDKKLTPAEKRELEQLMAEADGHRDAAFPPGNDILALILAGIESQSAKSS